MSKPGRRIIAAAIIAVAIVAVGTLGGFFDIFDLINKVQINTVDNEIGGTTFSKVAAEDKTITWPDGYDKDFMPTIKDAKAYMWSEKTDADNYVKEYHMVYKTKESVDKVVDFYTDYYPEVESKDLGKFISISSYFEAYMITVSVEKDGDMTEVTVRAVYPEE